VLEQKHKRHAKHQNVIYLNRQAKEGEDLMDLKPGEAHQLIADFTRVCREAQLRNNGK